MRLCQVLVLLSCFISGACQSYNQKLAEMHDAYTEGNFNEALTALENSDIKTDNSSQLLYHLEKGSLLDKLNRHQAARKSWLQGETLADELYTVSISKEAATYLLNEGAQDYRGEDFEKVSIHMMLALSFIETGELDKAIVEARAINTTLREITAEYEGEHRNYEEDGFARFLAGLIYEAKGELNAALIDYQKAYKIYLAESYTNFFEGVEYVPAPLSASLYDLAQKLGRQDILQDLQDKKTAIQTKINQLGTSHAYGDVVFIHEIGEIARKEAKEFIFPFGDQIVRTSFPVMERQSLIWGGRTGISITTPPSAQIYPFSAANVANMNAIAYQSLEDKRGRLIAKGMVRLLAKGQLVDHATRGLGPLGGLAANIFTAVTETADTRSWTLLPEAFYITRVRLPVGEHEIRVESGGRLDGWQTVSVARDQLQIFRAGSFLTAEPGA
ncbi:MAG: hypothetical protein OXT67_08820 [Zetaproteobacteria bacterium]|nr:hypothetical protein [Zetaproteobacteria bacterium]